LTRGRSSSWAFWIGRPRKSKVPRFTMCYEERSELVAASDFEGFGFQEIWPMDDVPKYTSRTDRRATDFFCFAPADQIGFWERERKRRP